MIERMHFLFIRPYFCLLFDDACSNRIEYPNDACEPMDVNFTVVCGRMHRTIKVSRLMKSKIPA